MVLAGIGGRCCQQVRQPSETAIYSVLLGQLRVNYAKSPRISARASLVLFTYGAGDEIRTRDILLGRQMLYQLSYPRRAELKAVQTTR